MQDWEKLFWRMLRALTACRHRGAPMIEGKCWCPDCGCGVVFQWVNLRCGGCNVRRDSRYFLGKILPCERYCPQCGEGGVYTEYLENARPYQLRRALLVMLADDEYETVTAPWLVNMQAWLEGPRAATALLTA